MYLVNNIEGSTSNSDSSKGFIVTDCYGLFRLRLHKPIVDIVAMTSNALRFCLSNIFLNTLKAHKYIACSQ